MSNKNYQDIINRIYEIYKELGISAGDSSNTPSEDSIKSTAEKILNNLISNPANSVGESIEVIKNKVLQIKSNTESVNNYLSPLKQKFDNIYNELNSTSSSYMKGKVNGIYSTVLDIYNILFSTGSGSIEQSLENLKDRGEFTYYGDTTLTLSGFPTDYYDSGFENIAFDFNKSNRIIYIGVRYSTSLTLSDTYKYTYDFRFKKDKTTFVYTDVEGYGAPIRQGTCTNFSNSDFGFIFKISGTHQISGSDTSKSPHTIRMEVRNRLAEYDSGRGYSGYFHYNYLSSMLILNVSRIHHRLEGNGTTRTWPYKIFYRDTEFRNVEVYRRRK